jgi:dual specificity protein kinase YAK1
MSKQRQQAQQQQVQAQAQQQAAYANMQMQYQTPPIQTQQQYAMYSPGVAAPPPYSAVPSYGGQVPLGNPGMPMAGGSGGALPRYQPQAARQQAAPPQVQQPQMFGQPAMVAAGQQQQAAAATTRGGRQRASTLEQHQSGIPASLQRVMGHLDPNAPIRLQPSPAYYPPPLDGEGGSAANSRRRSSRSGQGAGRGNGNGSRDFIRTLEDRTLEEGFMNNSHWQ